MNPNAWSLIGGIGLFLLGMAVMTDGLRGLAGDSFRQTLARLTTTTWSGVLTGFVVTALLHSSSATTLMAVGFVGAGLLTFPQAMGIILGANIGTTTTGWLVALLGFKLETRELMLCLLFVGALLRLFGRRRWALIGMALAGFGLVFVGIDTLREGMLGMRDLIRPDQLPPDTWWGRGGLVLVGLLLTVLTQSSSVGVVTALAALHVGSISLAQAGSLVIGMDIGTTVTAVLAVIGGNVHVRRTGFGQVVFNLISGLIAFLLLPAYVGIWQRWAPAALAQEPEFALVGFHSLFNVLGVLLVIPFMSQFTRLIEHLFPASEQDLTRRLERRLLPDASSALDAAIATLRDLAQYANVALREALEQKIGDAELLDRLDRGGLATRETRHYLSQVQVAGASAAVQQRMANSLHALDHLARLFARMRRTDRLETVRKDNELAGIASGIATAMRGDLRIAPDSSQWGDRVRTLWEQLEQQHDDFRRHSIERTVDGSDTGDETLARLDAHRWLRRVAQHLWRIASYLAAATIPRAPTEPASVERRSGD